MKERTDLPLVKVTKTDAHGRFDFGPLPKGHYSLNLEAADGDTWFYVEVGTHPNHDNYLIDISPVYPDCSGGHEFLPVPK